MKVLLIRPPRLRNAVSIGHVMYCEPLGLEIIYSILEPMHEVEIFDMIVEKQPLQHKVNEFQPDVVGITSIGIDVEITHSIAKDIKKYHPKIITMVGGTQAFLDDKVFYNNNFDYIIKYANTKNIQRLFSYISRKNKYILIDGIVSKENNFVGTKKKGRNQYLVPNRKSTKKYRKYYSYYGHRPAAIMQTSQGCSKSCNFCLRWKLEGSSEKYFDLKSIRQDILSIEEQTIMIFDNDFFHKAEWSNQFCDLIEREKIHKNFICYGNVSSILENRDVVKRFSRLGLTGILIGFESFDNEELEFYGNKTTNDMNIASSTFLKSINVKIYASFILNPDWSKSDFNTFRKKISMLDAEITSISPLQPFNCTSLHSVYNNRLIVSPSEHRAWNLGTVVIKPSKMSISEYYPQIIFTVLYLNFYKKNRGSIIRSMYGLLFTQVGKGVFRILGNYFGLYLKARKNNRLT